jgi:hypothetical protein
MTADAAARATRGAECVAERYTRTGSYIIRIVDVGHSGIDIRPVMGGRKMALRTIEIAVWLMGVFLRGSIRVSRWGTVAGSAGERPPAPVGCCERAD